MAKVVKTDLNALHAQLSVMLDTADYAPKVQAEIRKYSSNATIKGFRPGKTPPNMVKKLYGNSFLMDIVNQKVDEVLQTYLKEANYKLLGKPIFSENQQKYNLSIYNMPDLVFNFEIGVSPDFTVEGLIDAPFNRYVVDVDAAAVEKELNSLRKRLGKHIPIITGFEKDDLLKLKAVATVGEHTCEFSVLYHKLTEDARAVLDFNSVGDSFEYNIYNFEQDTTENYVQQYILGLPKGEEPKTSIYSLTILEAKRMEQADLNQEFYDKAFGEGIVRSLAEAQEEMALRMREQYVPEAEGLLLRDMQTALMTENPLPLPDDYMKRLLKASSKENTDERIEEQYDRFAENLRWTLIRNKLAEDFQIRISEKDMREYYQARIRGYMGQSNEYLENSLTDRVMNDEKQREGLFEEILTDAILFNMKRVAKLNDVHIGLAEFQAIVANARKEATQARGEVNV